MNKIDAINGLEKLKLKKKTKKFILNQIEMFYNYGDRHVNKYEIGDDVIVNNKILIHGTKVNVDNLNLIAENGLISSEFYAEYDSSKKKPYVVEAYEVREEVPLKDWLKKYAGVTIEFKGYDGKVCDKVICPYDEVKNIIYEKTDYRNYIIVQNQEQRLLPNDIIQNKCTMAFIIKTDPDNKLIKNDIFNDKFDKNIAKDLLPQWFYKKYIINKDYDYGETGREKAIVYGIPIGMIEGIMVSRNIEKNIDNLNKIKKLFPNCYICNLDGKVISV